MVNICYSTRCVGKLLSQLIKSVILISESPVDDICITEVVLVLHFIKTILALIVPLSALLHKLISLLLPNLKLHLSMPAFYQP